MLLTFFFNDTATTEIYPLSLHDALPISAIALQVALLGMYWDIALHIDQGRDEGPLANPAHYLILFGLYGVFAAGALAIALPKPGERPGPGALRLEIGRESCRERV